MKPVLTGDNGDQAANISNILACEDHPGPFTAGPPEPLGLIPRWPWWGCIYVRSVPLGSADALGSRPRKGGRVTPECAVAGIIPSRYTSLTGLRFTVQWIHTSLVAHLYLLYEDTRMRYPLLSFSCTLTI